MSIVKSCHATYTYGLNKWVANVVTEEPSRLKDACLRP